MLTPDPTFYESLAVKKYVYSLSLFFERVLHSFIERFVFEMPIISMWFKEMWLIN